MVDPMLATGNSAVHAVDVLNRHGVPDDRIRFMALVAAPEGRGGVPQGAPGGEGLHCRPGPGAEQPRLYPARPGRRRRPDVRDEVGRGGCRRVGVSNVATSAAPGPIPMLPAARARRSGRASALPPPAPPGRCRRLRGGRGNSLRSGSRAAGGCPPGRRRRARGGARRVEVTRPARSNWLRWNDRVDWGTPSRSAISPAGRPVGPFPPSGAGRRRAGFSCDSAAKAPRACWGFHDTHLGISKQKSQRAGRPPPCAGPAGGPGPDRPAGALQDRHPPRQPRAEAGNGDPAGPAGGRSPRTVPAGRRGEGAGRPIDRARPAGRSSSRRYIPSTS